MLGVLDEMVVMWVTWDNTSSIVAYGTTSGQMNHQAEGNTILRIKDIAFP